MGAWASLISELVGFLLMTSVIPPASEGGGVWLFSRFEVDEEGLVDDFGCEDVLDLVVDFCDFCFDCSDENV